MKVRSKLKDLMEAKGLTAEQVAEGTKLSLSIIKRLSSSDPFEHTSIVSKDLAKLCEYFGLSTIDELMDVSKK